MSSRQTQVEIEKINKEFAWGTSEMGERVMFIRKGKYRHYLNGTKMFHSCLTRNGRPKEFRKWFDNAGTKQLMEAISRATGIPVEDLVYVPVCGNDTRGSYVYPDLMIHAACWANPEYAILVAKIMKQYHARAVRKAALAKEMLLEEKLDRKRNKIDSLDRLLVESKQARKQARKEREEARAESKQARAEAKQDRKDHKKTTEQLNDLKERTDRVLDAIGFVQDQNANLLEQNDGLERHLVTIKKTLKTVSKDRVMPTSRRIDYPVLAIALNGSVFIDPNGDPDDSEESVPPYDISAIRAANGNIAQQLKYIQKKYPEAKIWKRTDDPNSMISWKYFVEKYGHNITRKGRECSLNPGYTMKQFWIDLEDCSDAKMQDCE